MLVVYRSLFVLSILFDFFMCVRYFIYYMFVLCYILYAYGLYYVLHVHITRALFNFSLVLVSLNFSVESMFDSSRFLNFYVLNENQYVVAMPTRHFCFSPHF